MQPCIPSRLQHLANSFYLYVFQGGHYVVVKKQWLDAVGVFVRDSINETGTSKTAPKEEESVEDMEMPF